MSNAKLIYSDPILDDGFRCTQPIPQRASGIGTPGIAEVAFARRDSATRLTHLYQHDPLRVLFPTPEGADIPVAVLLDNMDPPTLRRAVAMVDGRAVTEASGRITRETAPAIAAAGVDLISSGWITHSAPILDLGLDIE